VRRLTDLTQTSLKWEADGSLSDHDHQQLMRRLLTNDPALGQLRRDNAQTNNNAATKTTISGSSALQR